MRTLLLFVGLFGAMLSCQKKKEEQGHVHDYLVQYTCPMHPEIVEDKPGSCPICHMDLVERKVDQVVEKENSSESGKQTDIYTCPMHPEIIQNKPGQCPICGMDLVKKNPVPEQSLGTDTMAMVNHPVDQFVLSNAKSVAPTWMDLSAPILAEGYITYDTREIQNIAPRYGGRIEKLYVKYAYQPVNKGEKLFDMYSPDAMNDSHHFVYLLKNDPDNAKLIHQAREKLVQLGLTEKQIKHMETTLEPDYLIPIFSPETGHVHDPGNVKSSDPMGGTAENPVTGQGFGLKEGMYLDRGKTVLSLFATHRVWAIVKVPASQGQKIRLGQKVYLQHESTGSSLTAAVSFIYPFYQDQSTFMQFRVDIENHHHAFRIGEFVQVKIPMNTNQVLAIPRSAVVKLGKKSVVFIKKPGGFMVQDVEVGQANSGYFKVISGVSAGDSLALNAGYLVDSESFIKSEN